MFDNRHYYIHNGVRKEPKTRMPGTPQPGVKLPAIYTGTRAVQELQKECKRQKLTLVCQFKGADRIEYSIKEVPSFRCHVNLAYGKK